MRVFVTDGDSRAALAVVRSLGQRGHQVFVGERRNPALAQTSRYCTERVVYPDPFADGDAFCITLLAELERLKIDVLLPVADVTTALIVERRNEFEALCRLPLADGTAISRAADKVAVLSLSTKLGIPIPRTVFLEDPLDVANVAKSLSFPIVVKPRRSRVRTDAGWQSCSVTYALDAQELQRKVQGWPAEAHPLILQERISGPGLGVFFCIHKGSSIAVFNHRRLREKPPSGGVSVLCESVEARADTVRHAEALLRELQWEGIAMVEFKMDSVDDTPRLMEINGRFWGSLQLAVDSGVDFPAILVEAADGKALAPAPAYRIGVRSRWLWGDFDALLIRLFGRHLPNESPTVARKVRDVANFLNLWSHDLYYENPRSGDLGPWLYESGQWIRTLWRGRGDRAKGSGELEGRTTNA